MKNAVKKYALLILVLALLAGAAFAASPSGNSVCSAVTNPDGTQTVDMDDPDCARTLEYMAAQCQGAGVFSPNFAECLAYRIMYANVYVVALDATRWLANVAMAALLYTPDIAGAKEGYDSVLGIVQSLYSLLIAGMGLYWVWGARSPEGRVRAKEWSERLIALVLLEAVGFFLFGLGLKLNGHITAAVLGDLSGAQDWLSAIGAGGGTAAALVVVYLLLLPVLAITVLTLIARQLLVFAMMALFPFTLMLYMVPPTRRWGSLALNVTLAVIFIGAVDALMIYSVSSVSHLAGFFAIDAIIRPAAAVLTFAMLGPVNIWLFMMSAHMGSSTPSVVRVVSDRTTPAAIYVKEKMPSAVDRAMKG